MAEFILSIIALYFFAAFAVKTLRPTIMEIREQKEKRAAEAAAHLITYTDSTSTATLLKRDPQIATVVKVSEVINYSVSHEPEKLNFGAVSVGGVVTGGTYKTGGYDYISGSSKSGVYSLEYNGQIITKIKLSDELFSQARRSGIAEYLDEKAKCIDVHTEAHYTEYDKDLLLVNYHAFVNLRKGYPTKERCERILSWMCTGEANPTPQQPTSSIRIEENPTSQQDIYDNLGKIEILHDQGVLTDKEFEKLKADLMAKL